MKKLVFPLILFTAFAFGQTPCEDNSAGPYGCSGIDLQSHVSAQNLGAEELNGIWVNDIWGWVDPQTDKEYALVGMPNGTSFVDISDPLNPVVLGILKEHNAQESTATVTLHDGAKSTWRDIKVYANHAYIVSEDPNHGVQVFDLTELRAVESPSNTNFFEETAHYAGVGQAHNIHINEETGFLYVVGFRQQDGEFDCNGGGLHIIDISDPVNPVFAGCFDEDGYTHDTQCVIYNGPDEDYQGSEICMNANEDNVVIVDVTDKENISILSKNEYDDAQYTHQGWLTEDHKYFLSNDELDEYYLGTNTRTYIWDVQDLDAPEFLGYYEHGNKAIDHNLYIVDHLIYESNYTNGLRVLDTTGISNGTLNEVAYFDTYVSNNATIFDGTWSNYPFFPSGNIIISDITNGLFVVKLQPVFIVDQPEDVTTCVGAHLDIPVYAQGETLTYQWQLDEGSGFADIDDFERYKNTQTSTMHAHTLEQSQTSFQFRCVISNGESDIISDPMTLVVLDSPQANFSYQMTNIFGDISFSNTSAHADEYFWNFGDGDVSGLASPMHAFHEDGSYEVMLIASNACTSDTTIQTIDLVVAGAEKRWKEFAIFPTIVDDLLTIESKGNKDFEVVIYSMQGSQLLKEPLRKGTSNLSLKSFHEGVYVLTIYSGNQKQSTKIVVER